jgi:hypothetical protein
MDLTILDRWEKSGIIKRMKLKVKEDLCVTYSL